MKETYAQRKIEKKASSLDVTDDESEFKTENKFTLHYHIFLLLIFSLFRKAFESIFGYIIGIK